MPRITPIILFLIAPLTFLFGQESSFEQVDESSGLKVVGSPLEILQDQQGFLWLATTDGLIRYDGKSSKVFRHHRRDSMSLSNSYIQCIEEDDQGRIWVGTKYGLNYYQPEKEAFVRIPLFEERTEDGTQIILDICVDRKGIIWYGTYKGLFRFDPSSGERLHFLPQLENPNSLTDAIVWKIFEDRKGRLWMGTNQGLTLYDNDGDYQFQQYLPQPLLENGLKVERIWEFVEQPNGNHLDRRK